MCIVSSFINKKKYQSVTDVQANVSCKDSGVGTSTTIKRPSKRPRLAIEEEEKEEDLFEGIYPIVDSEKLDPAGDPAESVTALTESTDMP